MIVLPDSAVSRKRKGKGRGGTGYQTVGSQEGAPMWSHGLNVRVTTSGGHATFRLPINLRNVQNQDLTLCTGAYAPDHPESVLDDIFVDSNGKVHSVLE